MAVIVATWEAESRRIIVGGGGGVRGINEIPFSTSSSIAGCGGVHLSSQAIGG
jgi:hypothetical protein